MPDFADFPIMVQDAKRYLKFSLTDLFPLFGPRPGICYNPHKTQQPEEFMLSFQEKLEICSSFAELARKDVSLGRINFAYEDSAYDKKTVVYHLHPNGNGYVYAGRLQSVPTDDKGFANIREAGAEELRELIARSIASLAPQAESGSVAAPADHTPGGRLWHGPNKEMLTLKFEDELWYVFAGPNLDCAFETREEAEEYLREEGFSPAP
jgi:hypothetical protein